ncbi:Uncharacterised protein g7644 [Pycnogonum litorale]
MGKDSRVQYTDRRSRSSGSTASRDRRGQQSSPSPESTSRVIVTKVESGPPIELPEGAVATTKHEEWTTKKKVQQVVTKEVETRVQRQLVTEDGKVVEDSGPQITQKTREEKKINEDEDTQHKSNGDDLPGQGYVTVPGATVISTKTESRQKSHEVKEDHKETHDEQMEEMSGKEFHRRALMDRDSDGMLMRRVGSPTSSTAYSTAGPRIVNQYSKRHKVTDKDDVQEISREKDGAVTTERTMTHQTEEEADDEVPESDQESDHEERRMITYSPEVKESSEKEHRLYVHRDHRDHNDIHDSISERAHRERLRGSSVTESQRKDALTREKLDYGKEEHTRRSSGSRHRHHDQHRSHRDERHRSSSHHHKHKPFSRSSSPARTGTMRSDASSQTSTPRGQYYMGEYDDHRDGRIHDRTESREKSNKGHESVRRHESFHHEARSSYTPLNNNGLNVHRSHSQRSASTGADDTRYRTVDHENSRRREHHHQHHRDDRRSVSPPSRSPSQKYYLGEDPWRGSPTPPPVDDRNYSKSRDLRRAVVSRSHERSMADNSPERRDVFDMDNRKDLYAWEDHRSRDFYSHTTHLDDEERQAYLNSSQYRDDSGERRLASYSPQYYGPSYAVSAHSRSENKERDPDDPNRQVHRTKSNSRSEDVTTTPTQDGGKKVTVSKVRQNHSRSEMKYGDRGTLSPPPMSPPPAITNTYDYDGIDEIPDRRDRSRNGSYYKYSDYKGSREDLRESRTSDSRKHEYAYDLSEDPGINGHYKSASERQRAPDMHALIKNDSIDIVPDYYNRRKRYDGPPEDPVLTPPTFTPLRSPLSVKTADETKPAHGYQSMISKDSDLVRGHSNYTREEERPVKVQPLFSSNDGTWKSQSSFKNDDTLRSPPLYLLDDTASLRSNSSYRRDGSTLKSYNREESTKSEPFIVHNDDSVKLKPIENESYKTRPLFIPKDYEPIKIQPISKIERESGNAPSIFSLESLKSQRLKKDKDSSDYGSLKKEDTLKSNSKLNTESESLFQRDNQSYKDHSILNKENSSLMKWRNDKDNESVRSDHSKASTQTYTLEENNNTDSLKRTHLNPYFEPARKHGKQLGKSATITETPENELPMKPIRKKFLNKQAPPTKSGSRENLKKPQVPTRKTSPAGRKSTAPNAPAKKPGLVEVRGWDSR